MKRRILLLALVAGACGGGSDPLEPAKGALGRGDLDRVPELLAALEPGVAGEEDVRVLIERLEEARARRSAELERVDGVLSQAHETKRIVVQRQLQELRGASDDPAVHAAIDEALSGLAERYARAGVLDRRSSEPEPVAPAPGGPARGTRGHHPAARPAGRAGLGSLRRGPDPRRTPAGARRTTRRRRRPLGHGRRRGGPRCRGLG